MPPVYTPPPTYLPPPPPPIPAPYPPPVTPPVAPPVAPPGGGEPPPPEKGEIELPVLPPIEPPAPPPIEEIGVPVITNPPIKEIETLPPPEPIPPTKIIELPPIPVEIPPPDEVLPFRPFDRGEIEVPIIEEPKLKKPAVEGKIVGGAEWEDPENRPGETFKEYESGPPEEAPPPEIPAEEFFVGADIMKDYFGPGITDGPDLYGRPEFTEAPGGDILKGYQGPGIEDIPGVYAEPMIGAETGGAYLPEAPARRLAAEVAPYAVPEADVAYSYEAPQGLLETAAPVQPITSGLLDTPISDQMAQVMSDPEVVREIMTDPEIRNTILEYVMGDELGKFGQLTGKAGTYISPEDEFYYRGEA